MTISVQLSHIHDTTVPTTHIIAYYSYYNRHYCQILQSQVPGCESRIWQKKLAAGPSLLSLRSRLHRSSCVLAQRRYCSLSLLSLTADLSHCSLSLLSHFDDIAALAGSTSSGETFRTFFHSFVEKFVVCFWDKEVSNMHRLYVSSLCSLLFALFSILFSILYALSVQIKVCES